MKFPLRAFGPAVFVAVVSVLFSRAEMTRAQSDCSHDPICLAALVHQQAPIVSSNTTVGDVGFTPGLSEPPANTVVTWVPKGTLFPVQTMQSYSSYGAGVGGKLRYELTQDVIVNGRLIAMEGDTAEGSVQNATSGGGWFFFGVRGADLRVSVDKVYNFCGDTIDVAFDRSEFRLRRLGPMTNNADVHVIRGQEYMAFADRPQRVCAVPVNVAERRLPANALWTTTH